MAGKNTTGKNQTDDYTIGRGLVFFSELDANGLPTNWRDLGNAPSLSMSISEEELEHYSTRQGVKNKDKTVIINRDMDITFTLDEINDENLALLLSGETKNETNPAGAIIASTQIIADGSIVPLRWYQLKDGNGVGAYFKDFTKIELKTTNATPVVLVQDTDYEVHPMGNMIFLLNSAAIQTAISGTEGITFEASAADTTATDTDVVYAFTKSQVEGAIMFKAVNPANDDEYTQYEWHKVRLKADGDMALISDEWTEMPFSGSAQANAAASPDSPTLSIRTMKIS